MRRSCLHKSAHLTGIPAEFAADRSGDARVQSTKQSVCIIDEDKLTIDLNIILIVGGK